MGFNFDLGIFSLRWKGTLNKSRFQFLSLNNFRFECHIFGIVVTLKLKRRFGFWEFQIENEGEYEFQRWVTGFCFFCFWILDFYKLFGHLVRNHCHSHKTFYSIFMPRHRIALIGAGKLFVLFFFKSTWGGTWHHSLLWHHSHMWHDVDADVVIWRTSWYEQGGSDIGCVISPGWVTCPIKNSF